MFESLRTRLLLWYTAILATVLIASGAAICYLAWRSQVASVDAALTARAHALAGGLQPAEAGTFDLILPPTPVPPAGAAGAPYHVLWDAAGHPIDRSDPALIVPRPDAPGVRTRAARREIAVPAASGAMVLVGWDLSGARREILTLAGTIAGIGGVALVLTLAGGWWLVGRALAPAGRISRTARAMVAGDFTARIPIDRVETEFGQLAGALNEAFDRLHASLERQRRFTADASHELRTPLATLSTEVQWALARPRDRDEHVQSAEVIQRAAVRMQAIVERLLTLARSNLGPGDEPMTRVPLDEVVEQVAGDVAPLAARRHVELTHVVTPITVTGDRVRLLEAVTNVVVNGVQHSAEGGRVELTLSRRGGMAEITVADTGAGIAADDLPKIFDPFFRADPARQRDPGGAGLGLALTRAAIEGHGGQVTCTSELRRGTTIVIRLPHL